MDPALRRHGAQQFYPCETRTFSPEDEKLAWHHLLGVLAGLQRRQMRRDDFKDVNILANEIFSQHGLVLPPLLSDDMQATAARQRRENDRVAKIGRDG